MTHKVFGITGWKNSGKTTLVVKLTEILTGRGYKIAVIKHAHHDFDIDHEGTDSYRQRKAGAQEIAIVSSRRWAMIHELEGEDEPQLEDMLTHLSPCDLVLVEGYKRDAHDKIEVRRSTQKQNDPLCAHDDHIVAIAADHDIAESLPFFNLDDAESIADFICAHMDLRPV